MHQVRSFAVANEIVRASFFERDPLSCARELIGTELIWGDCSGIVIEQSTTRPRIRLHGRALAALSSETLPVRLMSISIMECIGC